MKPIRLKNATKEQEEAVDKCLRDFANLAIPVLEKGAPYSLANMSSFEETDCRMETEVKRPFSSASCVFSFCAHPHFDRNNIKYGNTTMVTLKDPCETDARVQHHVLNHYVLDPQNPKYLLEHHERPGGLGFHLPHGSIMIEP